MSILSSVFKLVAAILKKVFNLFKKLFKVLLPLLIVVAVVYFGAPYLASWLTTIGTPGYITSVISALPGYIQTALTYTWDLAGTLWGKVVTTAGKVWDWYKELDIGTQAMIALGTSYAIAPEETSDLITDIATGAGDLLDTVVSAVAGNFGWLLLLGVGAYLLTRDNGNSQPVIVNGGDPYASA